MTKRLLILDDGSNCLDMVLRARAAGWTVKWWDRPRKDGSVKLSGHGLVDKLTDFGEVRAKWLDWADLIYLPDNIYYVPMLEPYRKQGYPILAPCVAAAQMEINRGTGQKSMSDVGIKVIDSKAFFDYDSAAAFVKKNPLYLVSKPSGDASKALSYVASDPADLIYMLQRWKKDPMLVKAARKDGFILQERKYGIEMAVGGWFGPGGWSKYFYENWEYKKLMADDLGVNTGEMGTLSRIVTKSKLAEKVLLPITPTLEKLGYCGYVDNNCIIDPQGQPWPMEWTMRDGWPTRHNIMAHVKNDDPIQWMLDLLNGDDTMECIPGEICVSVVVALPDFPYSKMTNKELCGMPVRGAEGDQVHLCEVMLGEAPTMVGDKVVDLPGIVTAGDYPCVITGTGTTIAAARRNAYAAVKKVKIPNSPFYRPDIGAGRMKRQLPELHKMGYAKGMEF